MAKSWLMSAGLGVVLSLAFISPLPAAGEAEQDQVAFSEARATNIGPLAAARPDSQPQSGALKKTTTDSGTRRGLRNVQSSPGQVTRPERAEPNPPDADRVQARLGPADSAASQTNALGEGKFSHLEIEVSHSRHFFKLVGRASGGGHEVLYECNVGLGSREFPTPQGVYYVTHIYDDSPWWIPPPNRAWAAGQSPSRRIYGGTMAPLLKKRPLKDKKSVVTSEDKIEKKVKLDDYGYRFHGTNAPRSIGRNQSHGCVRMIPDDAKKVAAIIKQFVGVARREESENGSYAILKAPVRLTITR